ncbi:Glycosyltransferase involved in cell wall bisynthesis [Dyella sp. OK004]|uniref:glycosyltransferase family 4 protein n=1 Tax=Dyella sp. OK004 TaxID=1855292 RepID=UPI0008ED1BE1|nr:glycosyltransferase family 4 protein [Dyella sp. OK004]SFS08199.1 Glycosyltransferase involved in cell wall bisynthesis [Dyella sp. OK004]
MKRLKVTLFSRYSRLGPSTRLRSLQYLSELEKRGIDVEVRALFPDAYLEALYGGNPQFAKYSAWRHYGQRISELLRGDGHDLAWIEGELFPYLPYWLESMLGRSARPYVVDYDDALFHKYDLSPSPVVRGVLGRKIDRVMEHAACVIAGNPYLAARAEQARADRVEIIPTVVDEQRYATVSHDGREQPVIGWIGSPATEHYLLDIGDVLLQACAGGRAKLLLVGARPEVAEQLAGIDVEVVPWSEDSEADQIARMDIGVMPLRDGPWERGKCGYKIIQYMACALPVVVSPVGVNADIVRHGDNGFLAAEARDWLESLQQLIENPGQRARMGQAGRERVEREYSLASQVPRLADVLWLAERC